MGKDSFIVKISLLLLGSILGIVIFIALYPLLAKNQLEYGRNSFKSISDLKQSIIKKDNTNKGEATLKDIIYPVQSNKIIYKLLPKLNTSFLHKKLVTNSCGMRGREISIYPKKNEIRIAMLGDSFLFGWGVEYADTFAYIVEQRLNSMFSGNYSFTVLNFGVPGYSTFQEVYDFLSNGIYFNPDIVLVFFVDNDFGLPFFIGNVAKQGRLIDAISFAKNIWQKDNPEWEEEKKELSSVLDPSRCLKILSKELKKRGIPLFLAINPRPNWEKDLKKLWALKEDKYIKLIHLRDSFIRFVKVNHIEPKELSLPNDPHPSPLKHAILGNIIAGYLYSYFLKNGINNEV